MPTYIFEIEGFTFKVYDKDVYLEYRIYAPNGEWRKKFVSKAGFNGHLDEIKEIGLNILNKLRHPA